MSINAETENENKNDTQIKDVEPDIKETLEDGFNTLMQMITEDIENSKKLGISKYQNNFIQMCSSAKVELHDVRLEFLNLSLKKIREAKACSEDDTEQRRRIYREWQHIFDNTVIQVNVIVRPIKALIEHLSEIDKRFGRKYGAFLGIGISAIALGSIVAGFLIAHLLPAVTCTFVICSAACAIAPALPYLLGGAALCLLGIGSFFLYKAIRTRSIKNRLKELYKTIRDWVVGNFQQFMEIFETLKRKISEEDGNKAIAEMLLRCKLVGDSVWLNNNQLESSENVIQKYIDQLNKGKVNVASRNI